MKLHGQIIVANTGDDSLTFVNLSDEIKTETFNLKDRDNYVDDNNVKFHDSYIGPYDLEYSGNEYVYCTDVYDNSVFKLDLLKKKIVDIIPVGKYPASIKYFEQHLYITNSDSNSVSIIDENNFSLIENIQVGEKPIDLGIDEKKGKIYVANGNGYSIDVIDLNGDGRTQIKLANNPVKLTIDGNNMYILSNVNNGVLNTSNLSVIDLDTYNVKNIGNFEGLFSNMLKLNGSEIIFITNMDNGYLCRMDIKRKDSISKIHLKGMPNKLAWNGKDILFISNILTNMLTVFDVKSNRIIDNIEVGKEPNGILLFN